MVNPLIARPQNHVGNALGWIADQNLAQQRNALVADRTAQDAQQFNMLRQDRQSAMDASQSEEAERQDMFRTWALIEAGDESAMDYAISKSAEKDPRFGQLPREAAASAIRKLMPEMLGISSQEAKLPGSYQEYQLAQKDPAYASHLEGSRPKPASVNLSVNTAEDFYSSLAKDQAGKFSALAEAAQAAPARIERADRVLALLQKTPYTGAGAEYKLVFGKAAKAAGFDYGGDDIANTEALAAELAGATLDAIKTSGLGSGQGFTDKDRQFLELASAGRITLDSGTLRRLAMLNKKAGIATISQYNERAKRLKPDQLNVMGMPQTVDPGSQLSPDEAAELEALRRKYGR